MRFNFGLKYIHVTCIYMFSHHFYLTIILRGRALDMKLKITNASCNSYASLVVRNLPCASRTQLNGRTLTMNPTIV